MEAAEGMEAVSEKNYRVALLFPDGTRKWAGHPSYGPTESEEGSGVYAESVANYVASAWFQENPQYGYRIIGVVLIEVEKVDGRWDRKGDQPWGSGI